FGPVEVPLYLCQPATGRTAAVGLIMMIANSAEDEPGAEDEPAGEDEPGGEGTPADSGAGPGSAPDAGTPHEADSGSGDDDRAAVLARAGHNPVLLDHDRVEHDLLTDSWFERTDSFVTDRMAALAARVADPLRSTTAPPDWLPLPHVSWTASGRAAEL